MYCKYRWNLEEEQILVKPFYYSLPSHIFRKQDYSVVVWLLFKESRWFRRQTSLKKMLSFAFSEDRDEISILLMSWELSFFLGKSFIFTIRKVMDESWYWKLLSNSDWYLHFCVFHNFIKYGCYDSFGVTKASHILKGHS